MDISIHRVATVTTEVTKYLKDEDCNTHDFVVTKITITDKEGREETIKLYSDDYITIEQEAKDPWTQ